MKSSSERSFRKTSSPQTAARKRPSKFIPNLSQLQEATKELPDPELWPDDTCTCPVIADERQKSLTFSRKRINKGSARPYRWVYEGKVLIRNRDI